MTSNLQNLFSIAAGLLLLSSKILLFQFLLCHVTMAVPCVKLSSGFMMPMVGLGTWKVRFACYDTTLIGRPATGLGHQEGRRVFWGGPNFLNYVQHNFPERGKHFHAPAPPPGSGPVDWQVFQWFLITDSALSLFVCHYGKYGNDSNAVFSFLVVEMKKSFDSFQCAISSNRDGLLALAWLYWNKQWTVTRDTTESCYDKGFIWNNIYYTRYVTCDFFPWFQPTNVLCIPGC